MNLAILFSGKCYVMQVDVRSSGAKVFVSALCSVTIGWGISENHFVQL